MQNKWTKAARITMTTRDGVGNAITVRDQLRMDAAAVAVRATDVFEAVKSSTSSRCLRVRALVARSHKMQPHVLTQSSPGTYTFNPINLRQ